MVTYETYRLLVYGHHGIFPWFYKYSLIEYIRQNVWRMHQYLKILKKSFSSIFWIKRKNLFLNLKFALAKPQGNTYVNIHRINQYKYIFAAYILYCYKHYWLVIYYLTSPSRISHSYRDVSIAGEELQNSESREIKPAHVTMA